MAAITTRTLIPAVILIAVFVFLALPSGEASISPREYESMQMVLRSHGYNLVCNAMATSDLQHELLTLPADDASFTIFAPTDAALYALNKIQTASVYTDTLRLHVVRLRLTLSNLRSLANATILPTLLSSAAIRLYTADPLAVSGVDVVLPDLFYSRRVAVHGLAGLVSLTSAVITPPQSNRIDLTPKAAAAAAAYPDRIDVLASAESPANLTRPPSPSSDEVPLAAPERHPRTSLMEVGGEISADKCEASDEMTNCLGDEGGTALDRDENYIGGQVALATFIASENNEIKWRLVILMFGAITIVIVMGLCCMASPPRRRPLLQPPREEPQPGAGTSRDHLFVSKNERKKEQERVDLVGFEKKNYELVNQGKCYPTNHPTKLQRTLFPDDFKAPTKRPLSFLDANNKIVDLEEARED